MLRRHRGWGRPFSAAYIYCRLNCVVGVVTQAPSSNAQTTGGAFLSADGQRFSPPTTLPPWRSRAAISTRILLQRVDRRALRANRYDVCTYALLNNVGERDISLWISRFETCGVALILEHCRMHVYATTAALLFVQHIFCEVESEPTSDLVRTIGAYLHGSRTNPQTNGLESILPGLL